MTSGRINQVAIFKTSAFSPSKAHIGGMYIWRYTRTYPYISKRADGLR
jgi:hypothetical protein